MNKTAIALLLILFPGAFVFADTPTLESVAGEIDAEQWAPAEARGACTVVHYDDCSGSYYNVLFADLYTEVGVIFDLPKDCGKLPGEECVNTAFRWYWTRSLYCERAEFTYYMYEVDESNNKVGDPIGEPLVINNAFVTGWNSYPGFGPTTADRVVIAATMYSYTLHPASMRFDNNVANQEAGCGSVPTEARSYVYRYGGTEYSPPMSWADDLGPINFLMDATFDCGATVTEPASWGSIKRLFR